MSNKPLADCGLLKEECRTDGYCHGHESPAPTTPTQGDELQALVKALSVVILPRKVGIITLGRRLSDSELLAIARFTQSQVNEAELNGAHKLANLLIERSKAYHDVDEAETTSVNDIKQAVIILQNTYYRKQLTNQPNPKEQS